MIRLADEACYRLQYQERRVIALPTRLHCEPHRDSPSRTELPRILRRRYLDTRAVGEARRDRSTGEDVRG